MKTNNKDESSLERTARLGTQLVKDLTAEVDNPTMDAAATGRVHHELGLLIADIEKLEKELKDRAEKREKQT